MSLSQKEAVFTAVLALPRIDGNVDGQVELSSEERASVIQAVVVGIESGDVVFSEEAQLKYNTSETIKRYVAGMVSNWLTKDIRLNGGEKYRPSNPGSRVGQSDEVLKNLKALRATLTDAEHLSAVDLEIERRKNEINSSKVKKVEVNLNALPAELLARLNISA